MLKVLFVSVPFYEYISKIRKAIEEYLDADVDLITLFNCSTSVEVLFDKITLGLFQKFKPWFQQYVFFKKHKNIKYDVIFVLTGKKLDVELFRRFTMVQSKAETILYLWDDIKRLENYEEIKMLFDRVISFDRKDCKEESLEFLPLFYLEDYVYHDEAKIRECSVLGGWHSDRVRIINQLCKQFDIRSKKWYLLLSTTRAHWLRKRWLSRDNEKVPSYVRPITLSIKDSADILKGSKVTIDMPYPGQQGLSIRTLEALAANTKLITTNADVMNYDFYNEKNICVIDRVNPRVDNQFMEEPYQKIDNSIVEQYSIESWVKRIFEPVKQRV